MMGHWNHRVVRHRAGTELEYLAIHEAYYGIDSEDDVSWTKNPVSVTGETVEGLRETLERMLRALDTPVLEASPEGDSNE